MRYLQSLCSLYIVVSLIKWRETFQAPIHDTKNTILGCAQAKARLRHGFQRRGPQPATTQARAWALDFTFETTVVVARGLGARDTRMLRQSRLHPICNPGASIRSSLTPTGVCACACACARAGGGAGVQPDLEKNREKGAHCCFGTALGFTRRLLRVFLRRGALCGAQVEGSSCRRGRGAEWRMGRGRGGRGGRGGRAAHPFILLD